MNDIPDTWWDDSRWYEFIIENADGTWTDEYINRYKNIVEWVYSNVDGSYKHSRWTITKEFIKVKFRYERDILLFTLRWS